MFSVFLSEAFLHSMFTDGSGRCELFFFFFEKRISLLETKRTLSAPRTCPEASSGSAEYFLTAQFFYQRSEQINWQFHLCA